MSGVIAGRPLRIAMMLESDGPGGAEYVLIQLSEELRRRGHTVVPVGPDRGMGWLDRVLRERGFHTEKFSLRRPLDLRCLRGMVAMLRRNEIDLIHSHEFTMAVYGAAAAKILRRPYIVTIHGAHAIVNAWRRRTALRWAIRGSRAATAVSDHTSRLIDTALKLDQGTLATVRNGIPARTADAGAFRAELGLGPGDLLVVAIGNLRPGKAHRCLLDALAGLDRARVPRWHLAIAGRGKQKEPLAQASEAAGVGDRVHLLGHRDDVPAILAAADVFAMPSLFEGLPLAVLEAMFAGKPVVASAVGGIPEAIRDGVEGRLVPAGDVAALARALEELLIDPGKRVAFGAAGRLRAEAEFTISHMADAYERLYAPRPSLPRTAPTIERP